MASGVIKTVVKSLTYTGTTNYQGVLNGSFTDFGLPSSCVPLFAYLSRGSLSVTRFCEIGMYGNAGIVFLISEETTKTPVTNTEVTITIYYI